MNAYLPKTLMRIITIVVMIAMIVGLFAGIPQETYAATTSLKNPKTADDGTVTWDCVWFGHYPQSSDGKGGFNNDPIKWRVLSVKGDEALLLADKNLDGKLYNETDGSVTWETSTVRSWLNGYGSSSNKDRKDYDSNNFINKAFTFGEQSYINWKTIENPDNEEYGIEGGNSTRDKIFLLSMDEVTMPAYGFPSDYSEYARARGSLNTEYTKSQGAETSDSSEHTDNGWWWLRSPGYTSDSALVVYYDGRVLCNGYRTCIDYNAPGGNLDIRGAVRPALYLNLNSTCWSYAGTVSSDGTIDEKEIPSEKAPISIINAVCPYAGHHKTLKEQTDIIINSDLADESKHRCLYGLYVDHGFTDIKEGIEYLQDAIPAERAYAALTSDDMYISYHFTKWLNHEKKGKLAKGLLYADGLIFNNELGTWINPATYTQQAYPGVKKYKAMLEEFIGGSQNIEALKFAQEGSKILKNTLKVYNIKMDYDCEKLFEQWLHCQSEEQATEIAENIIDRYIIPNVGTKSIRLNCDTLTKAAGHANTALNIANFTAKDISNLINMSSKIEVYEQYQDFLKTIETSEELPGELRLAAYQLQDDLKKKYWAVIEDWLCDCLNVVGETLELNTTLFGSGFAGALGTISLASFCTNLLVDMGTMVKEAGYTEGYTYLACLYTNLLEESREAFLKNETEDNAWDFYGKYVLLNKLRMAGEKSYLDMNNVKGILGIFAKQKYDYAEKKAFVDESLERLKTLCEFKLPDGVSPPGAKLYAQKMIVECPVDVSIYDRDGNKIITIKDGKESDISNKYGRFVSLYRPGAKDYTKIVYLNSEDPHEVKMEAVDNGTVSYTFYDGVDQARRFVSVPVKNGSAIKTKTSEGTYAVDYDGDQNYETTRNLERSEANRLLDIQTLNLSQQNVTLNVGQSETLSVSFMPADAAVPNCTWKSSDDTIVSVKNGVLTAKKEGIAQILCVSTAVDTNGDPISATCQVTVKKAQNVNQTPVPGSPADSGKNIQNQSSQNRKAAAAKVKKPKKVALKKAKSTKRGTLKLTWKRNTKATGYQAMVAMDKKFKKNKKTATIKKNKTVSKTFTKLKRKKIYYAKVRAYKQVGKTKVYGAYSKVKKAKVK